MPWIEGDVLVCPGGLVSKSRTSHRCRFVSVDDVWVWDSGLLMREDKRSSPGVDDGFRAIALVPVIDGTGIDVVSGRARSGGHAVEHVVSYEVRAGELVEVSRARRGRQEHALTARIDGRARRSARPQRGRTATWMYWPAGMCSAMNARTVSGVTSPRALYWSM